MRYFIKSKDSKSVPVLTWLLHMDSTPTVLPFFPEDGTFGLVVAHLLSGRVFAEVLPTLDSVTEVCGEGVPLGRLYFQIPRDRLYSVCPELTPESFGG
jgi:hypothetical protein